MKRTVGAVILMTVGTVGLLVFLHVAESFWRSRPGYVFKSVFGVASTEGVEGLSAKHRGSLLQDGYVVLHFRVEPSALTALLSQVPHAPRYSDASLYAEIRSELVPEGWPRPSDLEDPEIFSIENHSGRGTCELLTNRRHDEVFVFVFD